MITKTETSYTTYYHGKYGFIITQAEKNILQAIVDHALFVINNKRKEETTYQAVAKLLNISPHTIKKYSIQNS